MTGDDDAVQYLTLKPLYVPVYTDRHRRRQKSFRGDVFRLSESAPLIHPLLYSELVRCVGITKHVLF